MNRFFALLFALLLLGLAPVSADSSIAAQLDAELPVARHLDGSGSLSKDRETQLLADELGPRDLDATEAWIDQVLAEAALGRSADVSADRDQDEPFAAVDACMSSEMQQRGAPGASLAIFHEGEVVYAKGYGLKHAQQEEMVDEGTMFRIGSETKMMTAAAIMQQVEEGTIDLQDPITKHLPDFRIAPPFSADDITIHHLLTHSHALPDNLSGAFSPITLEDWAAGLSSWHLLAPPGSFFNYSNPGYSLAGLVLDKVTGRNHREYSEAELWEPAGMPLTTYDAQAVIDYGNYSHGHAGSTIHAPDSYDSLFGGPAGFAFSTPTEMVRWAALMMREGEDVLSSASAAAMQSAQIGLDNAPGQAYGYGIFLDSYRGVQTLEHGGNIDGYSAQLYWVPEHDFAVSVLANISNSLTSTPLCAMREVLQLPDPTGPPPDFSTDPATWGRFAGTYGLRDTNGIEQTVWLDHDGEGLDLVLSPEQRISMVQIASNFFGMDIDGDGSVDGSAFSFIDDPDQPGRSQWMRNRGVVGIRAGDFPITIELEGDGCERVDFDAHMAFEEPIIGAYGLENLSGGGADLSIGQDDENDPSSSKARHDLILDVGAGNISIRLQGRPQDDIDLFLLYDADGDGAFDPAGELIAQGTSSTSNEQISLTPAGGMPAGAYQVWVHGYRVEGGTGTYRWAWEAVSGDQLTVENLPQENVIPGGSYWVDVCAADTVDLDGPRSGLVVVQTGSAPSTLFFPVRWRPAPEPEPTEPPAPGAIFLPALLNAGAFDEG